MVLSGRGVVYVGSVEIAWKDGGRKGGRGSYQRGTVAAVENQIDAGEVCLDAHELRDVVLVRVSCILVTHFRGGIWEQHTWWKACTTTGRDPFAARANIPELSLPPCSNTCRSRSIPDRTVGVLSSTRMHAVSYLSFLTRWTMLEVGTHFLPTGPP